MSRECPKVLLVLPITIISFKVLSHLATNKKIYVARTLVLNKRLLVTGIGNYAHRELLLRCGAKFAAAFTDNYRLVLNKQQCEPVRIRIYLIIIWSIWIFICGGAL